MAPSPSHTRAAGIPQYDFLLAVGSHPECQDWSGASCTWREDVNNWMLLPSQMLPTLQTFTIFSPTPLVILSFFLLHTHSSNARYDRCREHEQLVRQAFPSWDSMGCAGMRTAHAVSFYRITLYVYLGDVL